MKIRFVFFLSWASFLGRGFLSLHEITKKKRKKRLSQHFSQDDLHRLKVVTGPAGLAHLQCGCLLLAWFHLAFAKKRQPVVRRITTAITQRAKKVSRTPPARAYLTTWKSSLELIRPSAKRAGEVWSRAGQPFKCCCVDDGFFSFFLCSRYQTSCTNAFHSSVKAMPCAKFRDTGVTGIDSTRVCSLSVPCHIT